MNAKETPHTWTFAEIDSAFHGRAFTCPAGSGLMVRAYCTSDDPEVQTWPAFFDIDTSWGGIGMYDNVDRTISRLEDMITRRFPSPDGWSYDPANGIIKQCGC